MAKAPDKTAEGQAGEPADFSHLADALKDMPHVPLHPLMAHPTAAFAAATAIGFGLATHMTSMFLGSLQGAVEATNKLARKLEEKEADTSGSIQAEPVGNDPAEAPVAAKVVKTVKATKPKPATVKAAKSVASKPVANKSTAARSAMVKPSAAKAKAASAETEAPVKDAKPARPPRATGRADDLKRIEGIGPKLEQVLNGKGILRFADLAALDGEGLAALDQAIGLDGRAVRDDWAGQARNLAGGKK
ncbi:MULTISPECIES: 5' DNA nuclease [Alphaproteobacteria]|uniref:NADH ubiquinone oxidoreductase n=2 Tax=Alphaproteobacteria TaxID=28211 RepID=A0A512HLQ9_9HYPH|nr:MULTISPECIES: 5' DNA nuclease [Alphaproteobacteria]GEO86383.1 NADH ubiquinone oxidoreductase [Ciceribacter naphthalenivorans]GLR22261.1 NADH ubiquinone oxidoreductase [Ciceribacter naphthalenivorans]GLT05117.1 NADH ubiquinone oxidoreductase [Sphingomonas psychrolutea]